MSSVEPSSGGGGPAVAAVFSCQSLKAAVQYVQGLYCVHLGRIHEAK